MMLLCAAMAAAPLKAVSAKDRLEGIWYNEEKTAKIEIYLAKDQKYWGKIVWLKEPLKYGKPKVDEKNKTERLRNRPILGLPILKHFVKKDDDSYEDGEIYDPKNGKTYSCIITFKNDNELNIRGYIGISLIGRTTTWTRAD
jgi:uncharacterized protein (DUF2147 family)